MIAHCWSAVLFLSISEHRQKKCTALENVAQINLHYILIFASLKLQGVHIQNTPKNHLYISWLPVSWHKLERGNFSCARSKIYFNKSPNLAKSRPQSTLFAEGAREKYLKRLHFIPKQLKYLKPFIPKQLKCWSFPLSKYLTDFILKHQILRDSNWSRKNLWTKI